ncbi:DUF2141 domain-containing protein [Sneathiella limimaris]|uniref:DUF2141 domain-containing protein n=1 Tax=Sneathiella limimaris TaxID=1964213 RepID=UPI00146F668F|nr:DUF2141 domain-containing protein [Sneathiella limimaris]
MNSRRWLLSLFLLLLVNPAWAAEIHIQVQGLRSADGDVRVTLFQAGNFLKFDKVFRRAKTLASGAPVELVLKDLPEGDYSFSIAHDENANGELDKNFFGIPKEGVGVSNNAKGFLGPPSDAAATFSLRAEPVRQTILLSYF